MIPSVFQYYCSIWGFEDYLLKTLFQKVMQHKIANLSAHCPAHAPPHRSAVPRAPGRTLSSCGPTPRQPPAPYRTPCRPPCQCSEFPTHMYVTQAQLCTRKSRVHPSPEMLQMLYSCGVGLLHSCFVCFIIPSPSKPLHPSYLFSSRVTLATRLAQVGPQCPHLAVCTAELLEVQVPSRPLPVVHLDRPQVERRNLEAQEPTLHRDHHLAILGPTEDPLALGLPVLCIQVNLKNNFPV